MRRLPLVWLCGVVVALVVAFLPAGACRATEQGDAATLNDAIARALPQLRHDCNRWQKPDRAYVAHLADGLGQAGPLQFAQGAALGAMLPTLGTGFDPQVARDVSLGMPSDWGDEHTEYQRSWFWFWARAPLSATTVLLCVMRVRIGDRVGGAWRYTLLAGYTAPGTRRAWRAPSLAVFTPSQFQEPHSYSSADAAFQWQGDQIVYTDKAQSPATTITLVGADVQSLSSATANGAGACLGGRCVGGMGSNYWSKQWDGMTLKVGDAATESAVGWLDWQATDTRTTIPLLRMVASFNAGGGWRYIWMGLRVDEAVEGFGAGWYMLYGKLPSTFNNGDSFEFSRLTYGAGRVADSDSVEATITDVADALQTGASTYGSSILHSSRAGPLPSALLIGKLAIRVDDERGLDAVAHESGDEQRFHVAAGVTCRIGATSVGGGLLELNNFEDPVWIRERAQQQLAAVGLPRVPDDVYPPSHAAAVGGAAVTLLAGSVGVGVSALRG